MEQSIIKLINISQHSVGDKWVLMHPFQIASGILRTIDYV